MSQQAVAVDRDRDLSTSSKQQPGRFARRRPVGIEAGLAALVLAALSLSLTLLYAAQSAVCTHNGYTALSLRREIEDLRAQNSLLRYQINLGESTPRVEQAAARLSLRPADPIREVDYVVLPHSDQEQARVAELNPAQSPKGLAGVMAAFADQMVGSAGGRAEASTGRSHRH